MADLVGPNGRLIAAEPVASTRRLLTRNLHHNGFANRTDVLDVALGATSGDVTLVMPRGEPKNAHIGDVDESRIINGEFERFRARVEPVDQLQLPRLDVVKIDVEGAEEAIWAGMQETLDRSPNIKIFMEVNAQRSYAPEAFMADISSRFPLRTVDRTGRPAPITKREVLASRDDVVLYLSKT
jgi:FkbM family methyltransferase